MAVALIDSGPVVFVYNNCGVGEGGFQPGNTCARGGDGFTPQLDYQVGGKKTVGDAFKAVSIMESISYMEKDLKKVAREHKKNPTPETQKEIDSFNNYIAKDRGRLEREISSLSERMTELDEKQAVYSYAATTGYSAISALAVGDIEGFRGSEANPVVTRIAAIDKAINRSRLEEDTTVYRGTRFVPKDVAVGQEITSPVYSYSTKDEGYAKPFATGEAEETGGKKGWLVEIRAKAGSRALDVNKTIGDKHESSFENAVLFPRNAKFKVAAVDKKARRVTVTWDDSEPTANNCGTGAGGFQPGNTCASGSSAAAIHLSDKVKSSAYKLDIIIGEYEEGEIDEHELKKHYDKHKELASQLEAEFDKGEGEFTDKEKESIYSVMEESSQILDYAVETLPDNPDEEFETDESDVDPAEKFPQKLSELGHVKALGGSTGAKLMKDADGNQFVVKGGNSQGHINEEFAADQMYAAAGLKAPVAKMVPDGNGAQVKVAEFVEGKPLGQLSGAEKAAAIEKVKTGFAMDALMANWDVVGHDQDNVLVDKDGNVHRIDNGGSLRYRAQGAQKNDFNAEVTELTSMRAGTNAGKVFNTLSNAEVAGQIYALNEKRDAILEATPSDLKERMAARLDYMVKWADKSVTEYTYGSDPGTIQHAIDGVIKGNVGLNPLEPIHPGTQKALTQLINEKNKALGKAQDFVYKSASEANNLSQAAKKVSTESVGTFNGPADGKSLASHLKSSDGGYSALFLKKVHFLNANGVSDGVVNVPPGATPAQIAHLEKTFPGAKVNTVASMKDAGWVKGGKGLTTGKLTAATLSSMPDGVGVKDAKYNTVKTAPGKVEEAKSLAAPKSVVKWQTTQTYETWSGLPPSQKAELSLGKGISSQKNKAWKNSLTSSEYGALESWTGSSALIRADFKKHGAAISPDAKAFMSAVEKAPVYQGIVYRGIGGLGSEAKMAMFSELGVGGTYVEKAPSSSSRSPKKASEFGSVMMAIRSKTARSIENVGWHKSEKEHILMPNTKYRVLNIVKNAKTNVGSKKMLVELEEI